MEVQPINAGIFPSYLQFSLDLQHVWEQFQERSPWEHILEAQFHTQVPADHSGAVSQFTPTFSLQ